MPEADIFQKKKLKLTANKIEVIINPKKVRDFYKSGAYIPISSDYSNYMAYVIILKKGVSE